MARLLAAFLLCGLVFASGATRQRQTTTQPCGQKLSEWLKLLHEAAEPRQRQIALLVVTEMADRKNRTVESR